MRLLVFLTVLFLSIEAYAADTLLMFSSRYCEFCRAWHREIGASYHTTPESKMFELVVVEEGNELPEEFKHITPSYYVPVFVIIKNGKEIGRMKGYINSEHWWWQFSSYTNR